MKQRSELHIPADHPAFAGHFPGMPIVPGVLLLDAALHAIAGGREESAQGWQITSVKFMSPLKPGEAASIEHEVQANGSIRFEILDGERSIVSGSLSPNQL